MIGGLGPGGNAIYALDITNPGMSGANNFSEVSASSTVIGEWSNLAGVTNLSCANNAGCGNNLGQTYGMPQIRRFHNGMWGAVFGNGYKQERRWRHLCHAHQPKHRRHYVLLSEHIDGLGSLGIYLVRERPGRHSTCNGIYYAASADLDGDNITDYVYAGDLLGNVWRFDLTSTNPANWGVTNSNGVSTTANGGSPSNRRDPSRRPTARCSVR